MTRSKTQGYCRVSCRLKPYTEVAKLLAHPLSNTSCGSSPFNWPSLYAVQICFLRLSYVQENKLWMYTFNNDREVWLQHCSYPALLNTMIRCKGHLLKSSTFTGQEVRQKTSNWNKTGVREIRYYMSSAPALFKLLTAGSKIRLCLPEPTVKDEGCA